MVLLTHNLTIPLIKLLIKLKVEKSFKFLSLIIFVASVTTSKTFFTTFLSLDVARQVSRSVNSKFV